ncbi:MAG: protein kinase [Myxococcales bacterium]|nr:protein kinase [Myxococcales bacterium]
MPAPAPPRAEPSGELMFDSGLFDDDFDEEYATAIHAPDERSLGAPEPEPELEPELAPEHSGTRDTLPNPDRNGPTNPPRGGPSLASADTVPRLPSNPSAETSGRRPTTAIRSTAERSVKAGTQMHGTEGLQAPAADAPKLRLVPGKTIPGTRYQIERWLGEGGMGVVYEVSHIDIERRSALKILRFDLSQQPQMAQVFRDEARAASRLGSPYIVEVYDFGELPDGRLFFAMELLQGTDLVPSDETTSMDPGRLVGILRQVCKGLAKAHEAGVVHRDVKPENIIVSDVNSRPDAVKIVDFGISAMLAAGERRAGIAGTPHYMAPEQILGDDFDGRLDVYALGCTAYELMVGVPPFDAEEVEDILKLQLHEAPIPPRQRRPDLSIPEPLESVVMRCLAKDPARRYADMADLEAALCEAQIAAGLVTGWDDLPVPSLPDVDRYQRIVAAMPSNLPPAPKRSWLWPVVAGTSTLAAVGLGAFLMFGRQPTDEEKDLVEQVTIEARDAASKAAWVIPPPNLDSEVTALIKVEELDRIEGTAEKMADERAEQLREEFATTLIGHGDKLWDVARDISRQYYIWALLFDPDNEHALERASIDAIILDGFRKRALAGEFNEFEQMIAGVAALGALEDEDQKAAISSAMQESMENADDMAPQAMASLERGASRAGIALPPSKRGSGADGVEDGAGSRGSRRGSPDRDDPDAADGLGGDDDELVDEGGELEGDDEGMADESDPSRRKRRHKVNASLGESKGKRDPARSRELTELADAKRKQGLRAEAKTLYGQAIAANPANGDAHLGLALVHFDMGAYHKSRKSAEQAVRYSPRDGKAYKALGDAFYRELEYHDALAAYKEAQRLGVNVRSRIADVEKMLEK